MLGLWVSFLDPIWFYTNIKLVNPPIVIEIKKNTGNEEEAIEPLNKPLSENLQQNNKENSKEPEPEQEPVPEQEETPGSYDEDDISIYYDYTNEETEDKPNVFKYAGEIFKQKVKI